jgi:outer membrane protein assembly factor BamD
LKTIPIHVWAVVAALMIAGCGGKKLLVQRDAQSYFDEASREFAKRHYVKASELFQRVVVNYPGSTLADDAQFKVGECRFQAKEYTEATFDYQRLIDDYPSSPFAETSRFQIAACYAALSNRADLDQTDTRKAITEFQRFIDDYPDSRLVPDARARQLELRGKLAVKDLHIADNYLQWNDSEAARIYYQRILDQYAETPVAGDARLGLALAKAKKGDVEGALAELQQLLTDGTAPSLRKRAQAQIDALRKKQTTSRKEPGPESGSPGRPPGGGLRPHP